jgi:arylsulfatase A-like enzyme
MANRKDITRREMLSRSAASALLAASAGTQAEGPPRPINVLYINTDQQRWDAMSCAGSPFVKTPNMDRLAREGLRFTRAYTPQPMCTPARTCIMTGLSIHTSGCVTNTEATQGGPMDFRGGSFDQHLAKLGYHCEYHGRYHSPMALTDAYANTVTLDFIGPYKARLLERLGEAPAPMPGQYVNYLSGWPYTPDPPDFNYRKTINKPPLHGVEGVHYGVDATPPELSYSAFVADETIDALRRNKDKPFCITSAYLHPHHPQYVPQGWTDRVKPADMRPPDTMRDRRENTPWADWAWQIDDLDMENMALLHARYYQLVEETDYHIGRVLHALDELDLTDNTLVVFLSDHGEFLGWHGLMQKFLPYEDSVRVPYIMRLPGVIAAGSKVDHVVNLMDTLATICDYLGIAPTAQEGHSLRPLAEGRGGDYPEFTLSEFGWEQGYTMFASEEWKYVWTGPAETMDVLFNLKDDPLETTNLLGKHPEREKYLPEVRRIRAAMAGWMEGIGHKYRERLLKSEIG